MKPTISVAITTYNEISRSGGRWLCENIRALLDSPHVGDIVVVNDGTPDYGELSTMLYRDFNTRVRCQQNLENLGVFGNKLTSLAAARGEWCLIADSDNVFTAGFFNRLMKLAPWEPDVAYVASVGQTEFDYRPFIGDWRLLTASAIPTMPCGWCLCNCGNWFVHRESFLSAFEGIPRSRFDMYQPNYFGVSASDRSDWHWRLVYDALDSFYINKQWWLAGGTLRVVDGLEYVHRVDRQKPGNYDRSPAQKEALGPIYLAELIDAAAGRNHGYTLIKQGGQCFYLRRDDGATVIVNFHTGEVQICPAEVIAEQAADATAVEVVAEAAAEVESVAVEWPAELTAEPASSPCENSATAADSVINSSSAPLRKRGRPRKVRSGE